MGHSSPSLSGTPRLTQDLAGGNLCRPQSRRHLGLGILLSPEGQPGPGTDRRGQEYRPDPYRVVWSCQIAILTSRPLAEAVVPGFQSCSRLFSEAPIRISHGKRPVTFDGDDDRRVHAREIGVAGAIPRIIQLDLRSPGCASFVDTKLPPAFW